MIRVVARQEFASCLRDGRLVAGAVALAALALLAVVTAAVRYDELARERATAQSLVEEQWLAQGEKNPHSAAHYGLYAFRPALPLAFFDPGVSLYTGVSIWLEAHKRNFALGRPADDMTPLARFGELSLAFVLQALLPLMLILAGYGALAAERDNGTLRQVLSSGIAPLKLFTGKFLGLGTAAVVAVAPIVLLAIVALAATSGTRWLGPSLALVALYTVYAVIVLLLTLVVSARAASARNALLILLGAWAVTTFVMPRLAADLGRHAQALPTLSEFTTALDADLAAGVDGVSPAVMIEQRREALLKLYKRQRIEDLPINFQGIVFGIQDEVSHAAYDKQYALLERAIDRQIDTFEALTVLSPRMAVSLISQELSGTSVQQQRHFERAAETFRRKVMQKLNQDIALNSRGGDTNYRAGAALWSQTAGFEYRPEAFTSSLARCGAPLTVLGLWLALALALAFATARHLRAIAA